MLLFCKGLLRVLARYDAKTPKNTASIPRIMFKKSMQLFLVEHTPDVTLVLKNASVLQRLIKGTC